VRRTPAKQEKKEQEATGGDGSFGEMAEQASDYLSQGVSQTRECIREYSGTAVAVSLVAFSIGLAIGHALGAPRHHSRSWRDRVTAEGFGRRLMDRIEAMIPDALAEHFGK
jgi:hypothetical protein